jgi:hypothetical protein
MKGRTAEWPGRLFTYPQGARARLLRIYAASGRATACVYSTAYVRGMSLARLLEPTECFNPIAVLMRAEALSRKEGHVGAVAFSRTGDPATGD